MSAKGHSRPPHIPLDQLLSELPAGTSRVFGKATDQEASTLSRPAQILARVVGEGRMMTREERVAFIDDIRSGSKPTDEDSTDLIRRDRDER